jgi:hypothetical protein
MVELRCELGLAQEQLSRDLITAPVVVQHLDHDIAPEHRLGTAIHRAAAPLADLLAKQVPTQCPPREIAIHHRLGHAQ